MSSITQTRGDTVGEAQKARRVELKLEAFAVPVADVDRAKKFYGSLGWRLDADFPFDNGFRVVQLTPPGSGCSIQFGTKLTSARPAPPRGFTWSSRKSRLRAPPLPHAGSGSAKSFTSPSRARSSSLTEIAAA